MADTSRTTPPSVAEMEAEFAKSRATPAPDPVADLEAEYQRAKAAPKVDMESEFKAGRPLDPRKEPAPIPIQAAKGLAPNKPAPDLSKAEAELQDVLIEYNTWTNHPDPKGDALAQVEARRMRRAPSDKSAKITPFATGEVAERIKAATEPGSIGYRAAEALAPKWYGPAAQTERRHYWRVAESEADRQLARVVRQQMLMDQGVPKDAATIRAQAAYELGIPLLVPTQDNPRFSAGPGVDIGVSKVTDLENTFGQGVADLAAGTMDLVSETANLAKDVAVDAPMAVAAGIARPAYEAVTGKEAPDPSKAVRDWTFGSLTNAVANALPESAAKESLRLAQERGAGMLAGSAEVRNALLAPLGVDPIDPDGDGILDVVSRLMLTQPKEEMPAPTPSGEEIVSSTVKNVASTPGIIAQGYRDILSGEREVGDVYADTMTVGSQMMTTPVMDLFASVSKAPGAQEQESSLGWFLRVPATALSGLTTTQAARIADYWLVRSGATSQRRRRVPGDPEMGFWEAHLPVIFTGNGLHDYVTTLYNGDSFTSEWMRTADTAATLPGISDALRSSLLPGGRWREGGTQLAMWADLLVPVDNLPVDVIRGTKGVVTGAGDALRARSRGMSVKESAAMGAATALPASFTHALMMSDPAYRAEWEVMTREAEAPQRNMGVTEPVAFDPDADMVRQATARAWMRRTVDRGVNPLFTDKNTPADRRALAYSIRETLTAFRVLPEDIEAALAELMGDAEAVEPAVGSVVPSVEAERLDAREAALSDLPPLGTFTEAVTAAATPREKVIAGLEELAASWGMDPAGPLVSRAFEAALSYYDPAKGAFRRVPEADEALLNRITDADATRALNRLRDASPAQVMENTRAFVLGAMPRWADERIPDRARVRSEIIGQAVVEGRPLDVKQIDAFLAVTDRIADALVARGVLPTRDAWYAKQTYTGIAPGSPDEVRGRGFIQIAADGNAIIGLARDANLGTLFHENAHLLRRILPAEHMEAVDTYVREQFGGWTVPAEEWFARQFESVLTTGKVSVAKGDTVTAKFVDALNKALRFAADVLLKVYEGGGLPSVDPVFAKWMEAFAGLKIEIEPVKADPPVTPPPRAKKPGQVVTREDGITIPHVTADGWGPAMLREAETRAAEALKDGDKAVQAWLSWVHAYLGEPKDIRAKRHRIAGRNAKAVVEAMLNAGRRIVSEMDDTAKATADAAFAAPLSVTGGAPRTGPASEPSVTFRTSKGSVYTVNRDGTTSRLKAERPEHPGDFGAKEASEGTVYVDKEGLDKLGVFQAMETGYHGKHIRVSGDEAAIFGAGGDGRVVGLASSRTKVKDRPFVGGYPVEWWDGGKFIHFGNEIVEVSTPTAPWEAPLAALPSYAPTKKQLAAAGYKPEGKGAMVHPETGDRYGWNGEAKVWTRVEGEVVAEPEPVAPLPSHVSDPSGIDSGKYGGASYVHEFVEWIAENSESQDLRKVASAMKRAMPRNVPVMIDQPGSNPPGRPMELNGTLGLWVSPRDEAPAGIVWLRGSGYGDLSGMSDAVVLHEAIHAATSVRIHRGAEDGAKDGPSKRGAKMFQKIHADLLEWHWKHDVAGTLPEFAKNSKFNYASGNISELVTYALTDADMQAAFKQIRLPGERQSLWTRFIEGVRTILGLTPDDDSALARIIDATNVLLEDVLGEEGKRILPPSPAPWESPLAAMSASSSTKDILATVGPLMDALDATKEERASFLAQVKGAIKNKMPVGPVATAFVSTKIRVPADVSPPPAPTLPDVLTPIPEPSPTPLPPTRPMPKAGTLKVDAYGQPRKLAGDIPFSIRKVKLADIATEGIPPGVEELARSFNADELDPTGVDPGVGAITVRKQDGKWVAVDGVRRAQALQELHRRGMAGEEPYRSILAGVQHRTSAWATGLGVKQPLGDEVFVRVVDRDVKGDTSATGLDVLGLLPQDLADATSRAGAVAQARIAASAAAIAAIVSNPSPTFQAVAPLAALRDGLLLYAQTRAAGGPPARWASQIRSRYVAVAGSKVLPVSAPSVHVAVALGSLSPEAFAAWLDGVAKGGPWARSEADIKATADLPTRHDEAIEHGRRLEMEAIEAAEAEQPVVVEPPGWIPEVGPKGGEKLYQPRQIDTPEFARWFGDSKVVDEKGRPLVVYHGTAADFDAFRPGGDRPMRRGLHGTGIWFTRQPAETGSGVGGASDYAQGEGARIVPVYVSIKNPKEMGVRDAGFTSPEELEAEGYDGAHMIDSDAWVAFRPTQIKSAIANVGTFDPENPSILRHHRDYTTTILPDVKPGDPIPPVPTGDVVSETVGRDQPQAFYGASKDKEGVATPYGMRAVKHRAIPAYTDPSQLKRALGYRADQTRFNARDLVVRAGAYALLQQSQARNARTRFIKVGNTVSVPVTRAAAVRARALAVLGDLPARVKNAIETRPRLAVGEDAEKQPLRLSMADAGRIRTLLNALDANGWIDALPADIAKMTVTDIAEKMTSEQFRQFHGAVLDAQSGAAPYRGRVDRYAIAANLVWEFAVVPGGWFTPVPLPRDAGWLDKKLYNARSWVGALILSTANYALAWEQSHPDMRPDIRPLYERMRREMSQLPSRLAESLEALMESKHKAATPGAMQAELEELARTLPGAVPPIGVNPRGDGDPSDLHVLRTWLFRDPPEPYGSSTSVDMDGNTVVNFVPHDFPRVGDVDPNLTSSPERPIVDLVAEVVAHEDVLNRILNPPGRRIAPEVVDLLNQARNRTLDEEGANLLYGYAHAALNAARRIGTDILTAAAGHSGSKDSVENLVDALERDGKLSGIALDAYEAFYQLRWTDPKDKSTKASIEAIVRTLGKAPKTLPAPFWVFDVLNRLNVYHLMEDFTDLALDRNYVFTLMSMTEDTGIVFKDLRDRASFAMAVKDAFNAEMRGTDYVRIYGEDVKGSGEVGVNMDSGSVQSQRARYTARTIMAHMGLRPDVLAERKGYKGEMATPPVTSAWLSLPTDPAARLRAVADPQTWREAGKRYGLYGRDLFVSTVLAENLAELSERNAPLAERLAVVLSNRESYAQFFDVLRDVYAQLKGSFITGGANGILAAALFGTALFGAAAVPQAAALGVAAWGLSWMPRFAGFANNSLGAVLQGVIELGFTGTAKALATGSVPAARAAYQSVRFHRSFKAVEMARTAVANIVNPRPPENVSFVAADGRVYSIADVMTISKHYGLDETQARSESAETIRRKVDRMYATYEADPSFTGQLWRVLASFFGRYKITENYRRLYEQVDVFFRYVWLVRGLQEGLRPEDAVARALRISFDYSSTSQLDRWINMIGMFWMYQRRALDLTLAAVIEHPATVFSMIRFMRAQDLTSGYADLNEEYERETETVAEYGLGRFSAGYLPVAGAKTYAQKMLLVEPPNVTAIKLMMDVTTADPFMVASRANPMIAVGFNLIGTTAGGPMVSMFRRSTAESPNQWKVPARFVMLDQALNGGKLTHLFGIVPMNVEDGTAQPSDEMAQDFYVGEQGRLLWDAYRSLVPGFSTWLTDLEVTDRSQGAMDALQIEVMNAIEGKGLGERQNYGSVFIPATDVQPRLALGADWERMRRIGIAPAPVSSPAVTEARPAFSADQAMREETEMLLGQVKRMRAETPEAKELRQPEEVQPDRKVGVDPNAPMGLERKR